MSDLQLDMYSEELLRKTKQAKIRLIKLRRAAAIDKCLNDNEEERVSLVAKLSEDAMACLMCRRKFGDVVLPTCGDKDEHRVCSDCQVRGIRKCPACQVDLTTGIKTPLADRLFGRFFFYRPSGKVALIRTTKN